MLRLLTTLAFLLLLSSTALAQPTYVTKATMQAAVSGDVTVTLPAHQTNDILLLLVNIRSNTETISVSGWTAFTGTPFTRSTVERYWLYWLRAASGSETNPLVDTDGTTANIYAQVYVFRSAITTGDPWEVVGAAATGTADPASCTGITTLPANSLVVVPLGYPDNNNASITTTGTDPAAYAELYDESTTGDDGSLTMSHAARTNAGATGTVSVDFSTAVTAGDGWGCMVLALEPEPPPVGHGPLLGQKRNRLVRMN